MDYINNEQMGDFITPEDLIKDLEEFINENKNKKFADFLKEHHLTLYRFREYYLDSIREKSQALYENALILIEHPNEVAYATNQEVLQEKVRSLLDILNNGVVKADGTFREANITDYENLFAEYSSPGVYKDFDALFIDKLPSEEERLVRAFFSTFVSNSPENFGRVYPSLIPSNIVDIGYAYQNDQKEIVASDIEQRLDIAELVKALGFKYLRTFRNLLKSYMQGELENEYPNVLNNYIHKMGSRK